MKPYSLAKAECANMLPDESCLGIKPEDLLDTGQSKLASPKSKCLLQCRKRCLYFEEAVLPLADNPPSCYQPGELQECRDRYYAIVGRPKKAPISRKCPDCGAVLAKRQRYCDLCSSKRDRARKRKWKRGNHDGE